MNAYTISKLAEDAGISVHVVRDYELRGLLCACKCAPNGYRIYDEQVLQRLRFVLAGKAAGISLDALSGLCKAMDNGETSIVEENQITIQATLSQNQQAIRHFRRKLEKTLDCVSDQSKNFNLS